MPCPGPVTWRHPLMSDQSSRKRSSLRHHVGMDATELRGIQAPLKQRYRDEPAAATVTLTAEGTLNEEKVSCSIATGRALAEAGLHPATGGSGLLACSGDMLLEALVACAGVTMCSVATALGI